VLRWSAVALLAAGCGLATEHLAGVLDSPAPASVGPALIATRDLAPGTRVAPADLRPAPEGAVVPTGGEPVTDPDEAVGRVVADLVLAGEVVVQARLAPTGLTGVAALLPRGHAAVAVPLADSAPSVEPGQPVDVWATRAPWSAGGLDALTDPATGPAAEQVAARALVVEVGDGVVTLAVPDEDLPATTGALLAGSVVLTVRSEP
jgi:Flp pilus assembly protein CpaB